MKKTDYYIPLYKDHLYHVYNRGNGKERIFFEERNYFYFIKQYEKYLFELLDTFAYCLLPNHFHLLVRPKLNNPEMISEQFRKFFISYTMSINEQEKRRGNLFQRGFKRKIIENEKYFYSAVYYIHSNPVHHGIVKDLTKYKFSSYNPLIFNNESKLCKDEVMEWFGGEKNFIEFHKDLQNKYFNDNYIIEEE